MIIKSMTRKTGSFAQLIDYLDREGVKEEYHIFQNLYERQMGNVCREFENNTSLLPKRKNGVTLYHGVLSIVTTDDLSLAEQKAALREIAQLYLKNRAPENIALGIMHDDTADNLHYHFVISANGYKTRKRMRLSKAQFARLQKELEAHVLENYPQLKQKVAINKKAERKLSKKGAELKHRTGRMPKREQMIGRLSRLFEAKCKAEAVSLMSREQVEFYQRGKNIGVIDLETGKRHRLKTLGLADDYQSFVERVELEKLKAQVSKVQKRQTKRKSVPNRERAPVPEIEVAPEHKMEPVQRQKPPRPAQKRTPQETMPESETQERTNVEGSILTEELKSTIRQFSPVKIAENVRKFMAPKSVEREQQEHTEADNRQDNEQQIENVRDERRKRMEDFRTKRTDENAQTRKR